MYWEELDEHDRIFYQPLVYSTINTAPPGQYLGDVVTSIWKEEEIRGSGVDRWQRTYPCLHWHTLLHNYTLRELVNSEGLLDPNSEPIQPFNENDVYADDSPIQSPGTCANDLAAIALPQLAPSPPLSALGRPSWFTHADLLSWQTADYVPDQWIQSPVVTVLGEVTPFTQGAISAPQLSSVSVSEKFGQTDAPPERSLPAPGARQAEPARPVHTFRPKDGSGLAQVTAANKQQRKERASRMPKPSCITDPFAEVETPESMRKTKFPNSAHYISGPSRGRNNFRKRDDVADSTLVDTHSEALAFLPTMWVAANAKPPPVLAKQLGCNLGPIRKPMPTTSLALDAESPPDLATQCRLNTESLPDLADQSECDTESVTSAPSRESSCSTITIPEDHEQKPKSPTSYWGLLRTSTDQISIATPESRELKPSSSVPGMGLFAVCSYPRIQTIPDDDLQDPYPSVPRLTISQDYGQNSTSSVPCLGLITKYSYPQNHMLQSAPFIPRMGLFTVCSDRRPDAIHADGSGRDAESASSILLQESSCSTISAPADDVHEPISYTPCSKLFMKCLGPCANNNSKRPVVAGSLPPTLPPSVEEAYKKKCIELKRRLQEVEETNDAFRLRKVRLMRGIRKMRLERAFLLETLGKRMKKNGSGINGMQGFYDEDSEGSSEGPPTVCKNLFCESRPDLLQPSTNLYFNLAAPRETSAIQAQSPPTSALPTSSSHPPTIHSKRSCSSSFGARVSDSLPSQPRTLLFRHPDHKWPAHCSSPASP